MTRLKTPEEMNILKDKLNKGEITWEDVPQELEIIRMQKKKPIIRK